MGPEGDGHLSGRHVRDHLGEGERGDHVGPRVRQSAPLLFAHRVCSQPAADDDGDPVAVPRLGMETGILYRFAGGEHRELRGS
ncbi:hypothetical protein J2Z21_007226 [Streptomyces griseochromogenes]|uniref:Uncharacterized protein n=1 Tax=Streptomyces griseochromogenes TaxID=68214 RepID=A0ABS4M3K8_9ACTN|nr:hypothetical protein [Streptomyces griseochromogenes]